MTTYSPYARAPRPTFEGNDARRSKTAISRELGACVYFIRCQDGLIKIGFTTRLWGRKCHFAAKWTDVLAVIADGSLELERSMHERFAAHLAHSREYFHPAPELIAYINEIRVRLGVSAVA